MTAARPRPDPTAEELPPVWMLHGQPDTSATWWATRAALRETVEAAGRTAPVVRLPDRPGYGHNPAPATDYAGNVAWLRAELDRSGVDRVVLAGHSWGGGIALLAAAADPRVVGIALLASVGPDCLVTSDRFFEVPGLGETMSWMALGPAFTLWRQWLRRKIRENIADADRAHARSTAFANRVRPVWQTFLHEQRALVRELPDITAAIPAVRVPALVVAGRDDHVIPAATTDALVERLADVVRTDIDAGHDMNLGAPVETGRAVARWLLERSW